MNTIIDAFDLWNVLVNEVAGSPYVFIALALLFIGFVAAKYRFSDNALIMVLLVFGLAFARFFPSILGILIYSLAAMITFYLLKIVNARGAGG
ncbi:MAG: hypothetical protein QXR60_05275 [Candidatus Nanoarchaeia archaeon]